MQPRPPSSTPDHFVRADWLLLAGKDLLPDVPTTGRLAVRFVSDRGAFRSALVGDRPRLAVVHMPPGTVDDIDLVAGERRRRQTLRAVLVNAREQVVERLEALRSGFDEAFDDDIDRDELQARLILLAAQSRPARGAHQLAVSADIELDVEARELRVRGAPVHLRPKEFGLMHVFARQPGRTFTRRQLLDRAWGLEHDGDPRTIDVHIRWLREKLEADPDQPRCLVTVRGVGYRLVPPER